jgi:hypothetical protein
MGEATTSMETTREKWFEAEVNRIAGEIALKSPQPDAAKAEAYFEKALAVARSQQARRLSNRICSPHHQDSALNPPISQLERAVGFQREYECRGIRTFSMPRKTTKI